MIGGSRTQVRHQTSPLTQVLHDNKRRGAYRAHTRFTHCSTEGFTAHNTVALHLLPRLKRLQVGIRARIFFRACCRLEEREIANFFDLAVAAAGTGLSSRISSTVVAPSTPVQDTGTLPRRLGCPKKRRGRFLTLNLVTGILAIQLT